MPKEWPSNRLDVAGDKVHAGVRACQSQTLSSAGWYTSLIVPDLPIPGSVSMMSLIIAMCPGLTIEGKT